MYKTTKTQNRPPVLWRGRELESYTKGNIQISYSYDVDGMRYQKVVKTDGVETSRYDYVYSEGTLVLVSYTADDVSDTARFIYDSYGEPRGFILNDTAAYLYLKNAQGDITGIVNENGEVILTCTYDAWGRVNFGSTNMAHMTLAAKLSQINPFTYRGYCYDYDIGMYYLQSRYYDPEIGRFINADSTDYLGATGTLLSYNLFAYCENDGVNFIDETGTRSLKILKQVWFVKFMRALVGASVSDEQEIFKFSEMGITVVLAATVSNSYNPKAFFTLGKNSVSARLGPYNLSLSKTKAIVSKNFSYKNVTAKSFVGLTNKYVEIGLAVEQFISGRKNYSGYSLGLELAVRVTHAVLATMAATVVAVNLLLPQLVPVFSKIATALGVLASSPAGLKEAIKGILMVINRAYA